jgi:hypothetical protein
MTPRLSLLALMLAFSTGAFADDIYRSVMPNGDVRYGESPAPGAKSYKKVQAPPSGVVVVTPQDKASAAAIVPQHGGVSVIPQKKQDPYQPATAGSGATYGTGPGPFPRKDY